MSEQLPMTSQPYVPERADRPATWRAASIGLGLFSLALGAAEIFGSRRIAKGLDVEDRETVVRGFGYREIASGAGILAAPTSSAGVWSRVAGDVLDIASAGYAVRRSPANRLAWGALAFVTGALALDLIVARNLDRGAAVTA